MKTATRPSSSKNPARSSRSEIGAYPIRPANDDLAPLIVRLRGHGLMVLAAVAAVACCLLISLAF